MKLSRLGICGVLSLISYLAMVVFAPLAYPGYDSLSMAVSELSAQGAPSRELAAQLNSLFGPCAVVSVMAVCIAIAGCSSRRLRIGVYSFAAMEWLCTVGYQCFPWVSGESAVCFQNMMHLAITALVVLLSIISLVLIAIGARGYISSLGIWAIVCLATMLIGAIGSNALPQSVFGIFERMSTFSAVVFNAVLGWYLFTGRLEFKR